MPFILNEEAALKSLLTGLTVSDNANPSRPVGVFYGQPDSQIRAQAYPYITIDLIGIAEDFERAHRGYVPTTYPIEGSSLPVGSPTSFPIPVDLLYQISTWSRQPRHDRKIIADLFNLGLLPFRFGQLFIPQDGTLRRLDVLGFSKRDTTEAEKRLFHNIYNIRISAELFPDQITQVYEVTQTPQVGITYQNTSYTTPTIPS